MKIKYALGTAVMSGHRIDITTMPNSKTTTISVKQDTSRDPRKVRMVLEHNKAMRAGGTGKWYPQRRKRVE